MGSTKLSSCTCYSVTWTFSDLHTLKAVLEKLMGENSVFSPDGRPKWRENNVLMNLAGVVWTLQRSKNGLDYLPV